MESTRGGSPTACAHHRAGADEPRAPAGIAWLRERQTHSLRSGETDVIATHLTHPDAVPEGWVQVARPSHFEMSCRFSTSGCASADATTLCASIRA